MARKAMKTKQRVTRKSRQTQGSEEETDPDFVLTGEEDEDMDEDAPSEMSDPDDDETSEEDRRRAKGRRNSRKGRRGSLPSSTTKKLAAAEPSKNKRGRESGPDASEELEYELKIKVRKLRKNRSQINNLVEGEGWEKVTFDQLLDLLKLRVVSTDEEAGTGKGLQIEGGGKNERHSLEGGSLKRKGDVSELEGQRRKSKRLSDGRKDYVVVGSREGDDVSREGDDVSAEVAPKKARAGKKGKGNKFVVGAEARSDEEDSEDDDMDNFIVDDEDEVSGEDADVSDEENEEPEAEGDVGIRDGAGERVDEPGPSRRRLQKVRDEGTSMVEQLADDSLEKGVLEGLRKPSRVIEFEGDEEECGVGKAGGGGKGGVESPEIPLKGGLTAPVPLDIPVVPVAGEGESESEDEVPLSVRKRRKVSLLEEEDDEIDGGRKCGTDVGKEGIEEDAEAGLGKSLESGVTQKAGTQEFDAAVGVGENAGSGGGIAANDVFASAGGAKEGVSGTPDEICEEPPEGGRRRCARKSDVSVLEQMLENRSKVLGLVPSEEEGSEEGGSDGEESDSAAMKEFIKPDDEGNYEGYGDASEKGESVAGASEGGVSEGDPTGEDEDVIRKRDFDAYLAYVLQTIREPEVKQSAREDRALMDSVRRCEEALTSRRTQLVESTSWRPPFKAALDSRPGLTWWDTHDHVDCQACGRANHPSTHVMEFGGERCRPGEVWEFDMAVSAASRLHKPVDDSDEENESEQFLVGRFCYARAMVYHGLHHYKWLLIQRLKRALDQAEAESTEEDGIAAVLAKPGFVAGLHRNINGFATAAERFRDRTQSGERGLVSVEEISEVGKFFELVEELGDGFWMFDLK